MLPETFFDCLEILITLETLSVQESHQRYRISRAALFHTRTFSELYEEMSGKGESAREAHRQHDAERRGDARHRDYHALLDRPAVGEKPRPN